jgi:hypothetical protein
VRATETIPATADVAAQNGLKTFKKLITEENTKTMGFKSSSDASRMRLGDEPLKVFLVGFKALKEYRSDNDPEKLVFDMHRFIYPVNVDNEVRSSLTVAEIKNNKGWKAIEYGSPKLINLLLRFRKAKSDFVVWVPGMSLHFIGKREDGKIKLASVVGLPQYEFVAGEFVPAGEVFARLQKQTKNYPRRNRT